MSGSDQPSVLIADDHPLFREALRHVAGAVFDEARCIEVDNCDKALSFCEDESLELIFLDLHMPGMDGLNGLISLRNAAPSVPIIVVSATEDAATVSEAITYGAAGYIPKSLPKDQMVEALKVVLGGGVFTPRMAPQGADQGGASRDRHLMEGISQLTHQQRIVLQMLVSGRPNKQIAYELSIVESTVKAHVSAILRKLKVHSRTQAVIKAGKILAMLNDLNAGKPV